MAGEQIAIVIAVIPKPWLIGRRHHSKLQLRAVRMVSSYCAKGRIRSAERTEVHLKGNVSHELTFCPQYADLGIGKEARHACGMFGVELIRGAHHMREETKSLEEAAQIREGVAEKDPEDTIDILPGGSAPLKEERNSKDRSKGVHGADKGIKD